MALVLAGCGSGSDPEPAPTVTPKCEKEDPKNVEIRCTTVDGLRSCRAFNRCR